ncbi:hypothetical protein FK268_15720 [Tsukamurella sputi]|uniref:Uncharacterized protein n=1 Tax=Tsukamurella sputi TaxID=2591848 RepID=A0A5C5RL60_9ACTN|nr:hypothetical protein [Tsukamurella sputi]TWS23706.1 hypothetical protein FK268_15720 [Tsukamurella sputi]
MIIWRGWGILGVLFVPLGIFLGFGLGRTNFSIAGGLLLGALGCAALGYWLNVVRPRARAAAFAEGRTSELASYIASGHYQPTPGYQPGSVEEARELAGRQVVAEQADVERALRNQNTVFWIPMQFLAIGIALLAFAELFGLIHIH